MSVFGNSAFWVQTFALETLIWTQNHAANAAACILAPLSICCIEFHEHRMPQITSVSFAKGVLTQNNLKTGTEPRWSVGPFFSPPSSYGALLISRSVFFQFPLFPVICQDQKKCKHTGRSSTSHWEALQDLTGWALLRHLHLWFGMAEGWMLSALNCFWIEHTEHSEKEACFNEKPQPPPLLFRVV